jgi:F420-dependent oxidoreductase-like protein
VRIAVNGTHDAGTLDGAVRGAARAAEDGLAGYWLGQAFGADALTALAVAAPEAPGIELGVAVVPIWTRSPQVLASQALTAQAATGGRLTLGIGLSHRSVVEGMWGQSYTRTARRAAEYLDALLPLLDGDEVDVHGETIRFAGRMVFDPGVAAPPVVLGALGPAMLEVAGRRTTGAVVGSAGPVAIREHVVPAVTRAATAAGRGTPRVIANVVAVVTDDRAGARSFLVERLRAYGEFPSFRAMLEREGVTSQADIALVGDEAAVAEQVRAYRDAGVTDLVVADLGRDPEERRRTRALLRALAAEHHPIHDVRSTP